MRKVYITGWGMVKCGRFTNERIQDKAAEACIRALEDAGIGWNEIEAMYASHVQQGISAGQAVAAKIGMTGINVTNVENACCSGTTALEKAYYDVANGRYDAVMVVGFEKMQKGPVDPGMTDRSFTDRLGLEVMPAVYAMRAVRHMQLYGTTKEQLAKVSVKNHKNGVYNPYAHYQKELTVEEVLASRMIADPITLLQSCPTTDGAAAIVVASDKFVNRNGGKISPRVAGIAVGTLKYDPEDDHIARTGKAAYEMAGIGPEDIEMAEVHDAFTIGELLHYESLGFCEKGEAGKLIDEGKTEITGRLPVNPSGGLLSRGHPLGMTGIAQICEIVEQMRGTAGARQIANAPKTGLAQTSGAGGVCAVAILER